jgi:hypothetical protein
MRDTSPNGLFIEKLSKDNAELSLKLSKLQDEYKELMEI